LCYSLEEDVFGVLAVAVPIYGLDCLVVGGFFFVSGVCFVRFWTFWACFALGGSWLVGCVFVVVWLWFLVGCV
ncbi:hypothetical protein, partial [Acinetobacter calcoaceticus]|uniref:hypothetical protein n=1 Tax=Acinetobacter calcoaceticus TaxID=471 RepID=UPI003F7C0DEA